MRLDRAAHLVGLVHVNERLLWLLLLGHGSHLLHWVMHLGKLCCVLGEEGLLHCVREGLLHCLREGDSLLNAGIPAVLLEYKLLLHLGLGHWLVKLGRHVLLRLHLLVL